MSIAGLNPATPPMAITKDTTNDEIDQVVAPVVKQVAEMLVMAGRHPRQAMQDIRRAVERVSDLVEADLAKEAVTGGGWEASRRDEGGH